MENGNEIIYYRCMVIRIQRALTNDSGYKMAREGGPKGGVTAATNKPHAKLGLPSLKETWTKSMKNTGRGCGYII